MRADKANQRPVLQHALVDPSPHLGRGRFARQTAAAIDSRRRRVAELHAAGYGVQEIVDTMAKLTDAAGNPLRGISRTNIMNDLEWLRERATSRALMGVAERKAEHVAQVERDLEYWRRQILLVAIADATEALKVRSVLFRDHVRPLMRDLAELQGLKAPTRIEITDVVRRWAREAGYDENRALELAAEVAAGAWEQA